MDRIQKTSDESDVFLHLGFYQFGKCFFVVHRELGQDLAVKLDMALLQAVHEGGVVSPQFTDGGVDADLGKGTSVALLELTAYIGLSSGFDGGWFGQGDAVFAAPHHPFGAGHDIGTTFDAVGASFYSGHSGKKLLDLGEFV